MTINTNSTESKTDSTTTNESTTNVTGYQSEEPTPTDDNTAPTTDEFGYDLPQGEGDVQSVPSEEPTTEEASKNENTEVEDSTGYGNTSDDDNTSDDSSESENEEEETASEEEKTAEQLEKEINDAVETLPENFDKEKVADFAIKNKLTKEQVEAYIEFAKNQEAVILENNKKALAQQRKDWTNELKSDATFGGEKFDHSVLAANKVFNEFFPEAKKVLTERGGMLPPYFMKDLLAFSKKLNARPEFGQGNPPAPPSKSDNFIDEMYQ